MHVPGNIIDWYDDARLRSPSLQESGPECQITFYYWLLGNSTGTIFLTTSRNSSTHWTTQNAPAYRWNRQTVKLGANPSGWNVIFTLHPRIDLYDYDYYSSWTDDVAIDDITFENCGLNRTRHVLDCDFETDFCSWETAGLANFNWTRQKGSTTSSNTGPPGDHTTGTGYYAYIESSYPQQPGDRALLRSPLIPATSASCFTFYYHM